MSPSVFLFAIISGPACGPVDGAAPGERATESGGCALDESCHTPAPCPSGERCSTTKAPQGLRFSGAIFAEEQNAPHAWLVMNAEPKITAIGGLQVISVLHSSGSGHPYTSRFKALVSDDSVFTIVRVEGHHVILRGKAAGAALLRITDMRTNALLDRIELKVDAIDRLMLQPHVPDETLAGKAWAISSDQETFLETRLLAQNGERLADQALRAVEGATSATATIADLAFGWDLVKVPAVPEQSAHSVRYEQRDGTQLSTTIDVVSQVDEVQMADWPPTSPLSSDERVRVRSQHVVCFQALSSGRHVETQAWSYGASHDLTVRRMGDLVGDIPLRTNCVMIEKPTRGAAFISVAANNHTRDFLLRFEN